MNRATATIVLLALTSAIGCGSDASGTGRQAATATNPPDASLEALRAAVEHDPSDASLAGRLAVTLFEMRETDEALQLFESIAAENPNPEALLNLGRAYTQLSRYPEAEQTYGQLLTLAPGHAVALNNLGNIALRRGNTERAIEFYTQAIQARQDYILAHFQLADALESAGRLKDAYTSYNNVLNLEPHNPTDLETYYDALYRMASLDISMGAHDRALQMLEELIRARPDHKSASYAYGNVLVQLGRPDEAQQAFARHLEIRSNIKSDSPMATGD